MCGAWIGFCGSIICGLCTLFGVRYTIKKSENQNIANTLCPFFVLQGYSCDDKGNRLESKIYIKNIGEGTAINLIYASIDPIFQYFGRKVDLGLYTKVINEDVQPNVESEIVIYVNHLKLDETQTIYLYYKNVLGYIYRQKMEYGVIQEDENTEDQVYLIKVFSTGTQERLGLNYKIDKQMYTNR